MSYFQLNQLYLQKEERATEKSEFIQGEIIPIAGASANHNC
ncbi:hypothetical protein D082_17910 [Synechocystis sp. PCC 6714]|nr:hypothetical protein D082_17910 [Synechocystis sp. PCC 6714]